VVTALTQEKIFQDKVLFSGWERTIANPARYVLVNSLRPRFRFDDAVNRITVRTMNYRHDVPLTRLSRYPASIHCTPIPKSEKHRHGLDQAVNNPRPDDLFESTAGDLIKASLRSINVSLACRSLLPEFGSAGIAGPCFDLAPAPRRRGFFFGPPVAPRTAPK